jgi:cell growth-regulating nucleolar protein
MVDDSQPNTPQTTSAREREEMKMNKRAPSIFTNSRPSSQNGHREHEEQVVNEEYLENGYTWGTEPVKPRGLLDMNGSALTLEYMTPAAKETRSKLNKKDRPRSHTRTDSGGEKKRKRDEQANADALMVETSVHTPAVVHSGLTGGLSKMMTADEYPFRRTPETEERHQVVVEKNRPVRRSNKAEDPISPLKRTRHVKDDQNGLGISLKGRAVKALSMVGGALLPGSADNQQANRTRRRASSSDHGESITRIREGEKRERKKHKVHRHNGTASANIRHERHSRRHTNSDDSSQNEGTSRKPRAIEFRKHDDSGSDSDSDHHTSNGNYKRKSANGAMVVFGEEEKQMRACKDFLANAPGLDSEKGYSL